MKIWATFAKQRAITFQEHLLVDKLNPQILNLKMQLTGQRFSAADAIHCESSPADF